MLLNFSNGTGHFDVDVDPARREQRAGYLLLVVLDHRHGAGTLLDRVAVEAAEAGIHAIAPFL
jgi:hypothetical protein